MSAKTKTVRLRTARCAYLLLSLGLTFTGIVEARTGHARRPRMFVTAEKVEGLRSLAEVRKEIKWGHAAELWEQVVEKVHREMQQDAWTPKTALPCRQENEVRRANREFTLVALTANRILDASLVALVTGERRYAEAALSQIEALFDTERWPDWSDQAHTAQGLVVGLRHGQLVWAVAVAYDWLYVLLTDAERRRVIEGLDRCAIRRYKSEVAVRERWLSSRNNGLTVVVGGFGIAGMALGEEHPDAAWLVELARPRVEDYMSIFGQEGEFNESVQYAGSTMYLVQYLMAQRYASGGRENPFEGNRLDAFGRWYMHFTFPAGRVAGFGDPAPDMPPVVSHFSALAAGLRDPVLQWFYLQYADLMLETHRQRALELLYYDPTLRSEPPDGRLPLGRAYHDRGKLISSRSSWNPKCATSVVYAKAGHLHSHSHADRGQVCIDGYGERLVVDLGSPPVYPKSHSERYYNFQQWGHNVFVFGRNETGGVFIRSKQSKQGEITNVTFDSLRGGTWTMDLTEFYDNALWVVRTVVHLLPRVAVVLDDAELEEQEPISMRWHTITPSRPTSDGEFTVQKDKATLAARVERLDGNAEIGTGAHEYRPPFDRDRYGDLLPQRRESFVEVKTTDDKFRLLSLFCVFESEKLSPAWEASGSGWSIITPEGTVIVRIDEERLMVRNSTSEQGWDLPLE